MAQTVQPHPSTSGTEHATANTRNSNQEWHRTWGLDSRAHFAAYLAYGDEASHHAIELVQDFTPPDEFQMGNLYWHLNFSLPNMMDICSRMKEDGVMFVEEPTPMSMDARYHVAFVKDPDGYEVELTDFP